MKRLLPALLCAAALVASTTGLPAQATGSVGSYIVVLKQSENSDQVAASHASAYGAQVSHVYKSAIKGYAATISDDRIDEIRADARVAYVTVDRDVSIAAQTLPTGINRIDGELSSAVSGNGTGTVNVDVAVIDTGISLTHPDLTVAGGVNCNNGRRFDDGNGHGSHVAGTIGAKDDAFGVVGVAPGARLWAVRVLNNAGSGSFAQVICGVDWVTANAATIEVANMSLGGVGFEPPTAGCATGDALHDAICNSVAAGVTYVVAAGNDHVDAATQVPAAYDEVITVSALADFNGQPGGGGAATCRTDVDDTFADFSNFGSDIDLIAPGVCILSTWRRNGFNTISGTSMASPHVAGAAALYKAANPSATPAQVKAALQAAGNTNWNDIDDPDITKEVLVNVDSF